MLSVEFPPWAQNGRDSSPRGSTVELRPAHTSQSGPLFFQGTVSAAFMVYCAKKGMIYLYPGVERKAGYVFSFQMVPNLPDEDCVDLTYFRATVHFQLCSTSLRLSPHFLEEGISSWNHHCSCVSGMLQLTSSHQQCLLL